MLIRRDSNCGPPALRLAPSTVAVPNSLDLMSKLIKIPLNAQYIYNTVKLLQQFLKPVQTCLVSVSGRKTHSQLLIQRADVSDSGNYTCAPSSSLPASIQVFVSGKYQIFHCCKQSLTRLYHPPFYPIIHPPYLPLPYFFV